MIKSIEMFNYKSFEHVVVDFTKNNIPKSNVFIYGENGSGKSNIVSAFNFLKVSLQSLDIQNRINDLMHKNDEIDYKEINHYLYRFQNYIKNFLEKSKLIGSHEHMRLVYKFLIENKTATYTLTFDKERLVEEELKYVMFKYVTTMYKANQDGLYMHDKLVESKDYKQELKTLHKKYFGKHSMLSILMNEHHQKNVEFIENNMNDNFNVFFNYLASLCVWVRSSNHYIEGHITHNKNLLDNLTSGVIEKNYQNVLDKTEAVLNDFFTALYTDIKGVEYKRDLTDDGIEYKLHFNKMIGGKLRSIPHDWESTGTLQIVDILPYLFSAAQGHTVLIDEIDSNIHDIMIRTIIEAVNEHLKGQLIVTTHNTALIDVLNPESVYVIDIQPNGYKEVLPINKTGTRIHENHNVKDRYQNGLYGGIPYTGYIDIEELVDQLNKDEM